MASKKTAYIVWTLDYDCMAFHGVYTSEELARQRAEEVLAEDPDEFGLRISFYPLDQPINCLDRIPSVRFGPQRGGDG